MVLQSRKSDVVACCLFFSITACAGTDNPANGVARSATEETDPDARAATAAAVVDPLHAVLDVEVRAAPDGLWLTSDELTTGEPFTEVLPSWNVSGDQPFIVDVRVSLAGSGANWSPWLRIGDWGVAERASDVTVEFEGGKVAVDVLELSEPHMRAQLRIAHADGSTLAREDVRASIVLSDMRGLDARLALVANEPWPIPIQLKVPVRSQRREDDDIAHRICSPTSVAMVAAYHGATVPTREMAETILDPHYDIYGNWNRAVQGGFSYGVPGRLVRVSSWDVVQAYLADGRPIVASIRAKEGELEGAPYSSTAGHLLVVTGLGPGGIVHVNDPAASWPGSVPRRYMRDEMENVWFGRGGVAYVFEPMTRAGRLGG